jgi:hypothetical protein
MSVDQRAQASQLGSYGTLHRPGECACYALGAADRHVDIHERAHLWPNHNALGTRKILSAQRPDPSAYQSGLWVGWDLIGKWAAP